MNREVLERLRSNPRARAPAREPPTQPRPPRRPRRRFPLVLLFLILGSLVFTAAAWSAVRNPVLASILSAPVLTPTNPPHQFWARAELPKAAYTPTPMPTPITEEPAQPIVEPAYPTETATPLVYADLVEDTPAAEEPPVDTNAEAGTQEPAPQPEYSGNKYILVDISEQHLYAYENGQLLYSFVASTGMNNATAVGHFAVQSKIPNAYGSTWDIWMPNWLGIYWSGGLENGIHALPILPNGSTLWEGFLGRPISYGCVVLDTYDSQLLYDWSEYGTPVDIQW